IGDAIGQSGKGAEVANLTRGRAARILVSLEEQAGPDLTRDTYFANDLPFRSASAGAGGPEYLIEFPPRMLPSADPIYVPDPAQTQAPTAPPVPQSAPSARAQQSAPGAPVATVSKLNDPTTWRTAGAPMTKPMRAYLLSQGHIASEIDKLDKGHASLVIHAHKNQGDAAGHDAMDQALSAMERLQPASSPAPPQSQKPSPTPGRTL
ncbi:MAG TPA: hypothetical protein VF062_00800, partial [Candidatus Limnocylindrales bacterium]